MSALATLLHRENELIARFVDLLKEEQAVLRTAAPDALDAIVARKVPLIDALNTIENERARLIGSTAGSTTRADMQSWLEKQPQAAEFAALWQNILGGAQEAKTLHLENQELLNKRLATTEAALDILMQRQKDAAVYGSDGQTPGISGSRIVDSA